MPRISFRKENSCLLWTLHRGVRRIIPVAKRIGSAEAEVVKQETKYEKPLQGSRSWWIRSAHCMVRRSSQQWMQGKVVRLLAPHIASIAEKNARSVVSRWNSHRESSEHRTVH